MGGLDIFAIKGEIEVEYYEIHDVIGTQIGDKDEYYTELSEDDIEDDIITIAKLTNDNRTSRQILKQIIKKTGKRDNRFRSYWRHKH